MKTKNALLLFGAMVAVSGLTAYGTFKVMEPTLLAGAGQQMGYDVNLHQVGFVPTVSRASVTDNDFTQAAEKTVNAVVGITNKQVQQMQQSYGGMNDPFFDFFFGQRSPQRQQPQSSDPAPVGSGSGVIISSDGYIVTNNHVIDKADEITVTLNDKRQFTATLVGTDPTTDIALLKVEAKDLPTIAIGQSDELKIGEWVLAVGNPFNLTSTVTAGIVSAKARSLGMGGNKLGIESFIQTDAAVNPGNSGGALVNTAGELVGINTAIYSQTGNYAGYSFAVPSSIVSKVVTDLKQYGTVQRALLGIMGGDVNAQVVEEKELTVNEGVYVSEVQEGVDKMFYHCLMDGKRLPDYSLTDEWQVCLRLPGEIKYPSFMLYARELQNARPANNKLNVFDLLALFRASQGESQRYTDEVTLRKLIDAGLLITAQDGYKLSDRYYEIVKNVGTIEDNRKDDTVNGPVNDTVKLLQLTERQRKIYHIIKDGTINDTANDTVTAKTLSESLGTSIITIKRDLAAMQSVGVIKRVGSDKNGHWEVTD